MSKKCLTEETRIIPKLGHDYSNSWVNITDPTCEVDGSGEQSCTRDNCDSKQLITLTRLSHLWGPWITDNEPTCENEGSQYRNCSRDCCQTIADEKVIPKLGHDYSLEYTQTITPTCTEVGKESRKCIRCDSRIDERDIAPFGHSWGDDFIIEQEPSCTQNGSKYIQCFVCDAKKDITSIPAYGHTFSEWEIIIPPNCENEGSKERYCAVCDFTETEGIDPTGHNWDNDFIIDKDPTCTEDGSKSIHCIDCDVSKDSTIIPLLGHNWSDWVVIIPASCLVEGSKERTCLNCNQKETNTVEPLGHIFPPGCETECSRNDCDAIGPKCGECDICKKPYPEASIHTEGGQSHVDVIAYDPINDAPIEGSIVVSKTIQPSDEVNEFFITIEVETKNVNVTKDLMPTASAAVCMIIDISTSMDVCADCGVTRGTGSSNRHAAGCALGDTSQQVTVNHTRTYVTCEAAINFLKEFKEAGEDEHRFASLIFFGTTADTIVEWQNITNVADNSAILNLFMSRLTALQTTPTQLQAGTFMQGGMLIARNHWRNSRAPKVNGKVVDNRFTVFFTDGDPNTSLATNATGNGYLTNYDALNIPTSARGSVTNTNAGFAAARPLVVTAADQIKNGIAETVNILPSMMYAVAFNAGSSFVVSGVTHPAAFTWISENISSKPEFAFEAKNGLELTMAFEDILESINNIINAWNVTDLMAPDILLVEIVNDNENIATATDNSLSWNLIDSPPTYQDDDKSIWIITYKIKYVGEAVDKVIPTNERATLTYAITNDGEVYDQFDSVDFTNMPKIDIVKVKPESEE